MVFPTRVKLHRLVFTLAIVLMVIGGAGLAELATSDIVRRGFVLGMCSYFVFYGNKAPQPVSFAYALDDDSDRVVPEIIMDTAFDFEMNPALEMESDEAFELRLTRAKVFNETQLKKLCKAYKTGTRQDQILRKLVAENIITEYQAINILWGREDRLRVGKYAILGVVGQGGMGAVFRAKNIETEEIIALKVLRKGTKFGKRFHREMRLVQELAHPNIVVAYDVGETPDKLYIAMELVDGHDLYQRVDQQGPFSEKECWNFILQAARALEHAHDRGIVHRDVKPGNLLLGADGVIKLADLGLSRSDTKEEGDTESFRTADESIFGTIDFMAPEQAICTADCTPASDMYSLGQTFYYLLCERSRVKGKTAVEKAANLTVNRIFRRLPPGRLSTQATKVFEKMVAYEPKGRFKSMTELIIAIEDLEDSMSTPQPVEQHVHVLIVEDSRSQAVYTIEMLKRSNKSIQISEATTLEDALVLCRNHDGNEIDIVLLDLNLPDSDGTETVSRFRSAMPRIPLVVLTGDNRVEVGQACIEAGANEYLPKDDLNAHAIERVVFVTLTRIKAQRR